MSYANRPSGSTYTAYPGVSDGSPDPEPPEPPAFVRSLRGANSDISLYWTPDWPLRDRMKSANDMGPFPSAGATLADFTLNANGFPTETIPKSVGGTNRTLRMALFNNIPLPTTGTAPRYPTGTYVITWTGGTTTSINVLGDGTTTATATRRIERTVVTPTAGGITLEIANQSNAAPITALHCWMPGEEGATDYFRAHWLSLLYGSCVRTMNFVDCNDVDNKQVDLATRITEDYITQCSPNHGMSIEYMVACANEADKDLWLCIPPRATDELVEYMLEYCRDNLNRRLYFEGVGNEIWNNAADFAPQHQYAWQQATILGLDLVGRFAGSTDPAVNPGGYQGARFWAAVKWTAYRAAQWFAIAETVYGGKPNGTTRDYVRIVGSFVANATISDVLMESLIDDEVNTSYNGTDTVSDICEGFAIAPYAGVRAIEEAEDNHSLSIEDMMDLLVEDGTDEVAEWMTAQAAIATEHGVTIYGYEGGFGAHSPDPVANDMIRQCRLHPRIAEFYENFFLAWDAGGGDLICHLGGLVYPGNNNGYWGPLRHEDDVAEDSYTLQALYAEVERRESL